MVYLRRLNDSQVWRAGISWRSAASSAGPVTRGRADVLLAGQHRPGGLAAPRGGDALGLPFGMHLELVFGGSGQDGEHEPALLGVQVEVLG